MAPKRSSAFFRRLFACGCACVAGSLWAYGGAPDASRGLRGRAGHAARVGDRGVRQPPPGRDRGEPARRCRTRPCARAPGLLYPVFGRVEAPSLGRHVVYLQWPEGAPDGPRQRQRRWSFEVDAARNAVITDVHTLRDSARWRDAHLRPATALRDISPDDVVPYPAPCRLACPACWARRAGSTHIGWVHQQGLYELILGAR
jgi:hypothetical protein